MFQRTMFLGCAAVALAIGCGSALAQSKFDVKIGGDAWFEAGMAHQSDDAGNMRRVEFLNRFRLQITPTAQADNGLEYGARIRLRANNRGADADTDRAFVFAQGKYGRVEAGQVDGPNSQYYVTAPTDFGTAGVDGDFSMWLPYTTVQTNFGWNTMLGDAGPFGSATSTKINYFTPRVLGTGQDDTGLMGMLSYAPNLEERNTGQNTSLDRTKFITGAGVAPEQSAGANDLFEAGLRYDGKYENGISIASSLGYIGASNKNVRIGAADTKYHNLSAWQAGLQIGYNGFKVGGGYIDAGKSGYQKGVAAEEQSAWTIGAQYETGPWVVGTNFLHGKDAGSLATRGARYQNAWALGATYLIAPGLDVGLEYVRNNVNNEGAIPDQDGNLFLVRTQVKF